MKAKVYVNLKAGVLDPQGKAIQHSVELLGFSGIEDVRQGKYFEIALDSGLTESAARETAERTRLHALWTLEGLDARGDVPGAHRDAQQACPLVFLDV